MFNCLARNIMQFCSLFVLLILSPACAHATWIRTRENGDSSKHGSGSGKKERKYSTIQGGQDQGDLPITFLFLLFFVRSTSALLFQKYIKNCKKYSTQFNPINILKCRRFFGAFDIFLARFISSRISKKFWTVLT
jgi:hypothetical protein